jgi:hypothetical protein
LRGKYEYSKRIKGKIQSDGTQTLRYTLYLKGNIFITARSATFGKFSSTTPLPERQD